MTKYKVLISTLGRSHFVIATEWLVKRGVNATLLQGWIPKDLNSIGVRLAAKIIRRKSFVPGLAKRKPAALEGRQISEPLGEIVQTIGMLTVAKISKTLANLSMSFAFWVHGFCTRKYLERFEIFHVRSGFGRAGAIRKARRLGMKILVDHCAAHPFAMMRNTGNRNYGNRWSYWNMVLKDCRNADLIMVGSEYVKETFVEFGYDPKMFRVVPLGVLSIFGHVKTSYAKSGCLELIYTGNWGEWKGVNDLIDAIEILVNKGVDVHLTAVGSFSENSASYKKSRRLNLPVTFAGHVPQEDLRGFLANAEIYVFPSLGDGFAVSAFEGMSAGLCLIATRESSIPLKEGETGFRVPAHDPTAIADRVEYLYSHRDVIESVGRTAADYVEKNFTWEKYAENVEKVYDELMAR